MGLRPRQHLSSVTDTNRGRLVVILLALAAGAAITAALLNLQIDAKRRLTTEFRSFGANVIIAPGGSIAAPESQNYLDETKYHALVGQRKLQLVRDRIPLWRRDSRADKSVCRP